MPHPPAEPVLPAVPPVGATPGPDYSGVEGSAPVPPPPHPPHRGWRALEDRILQALARVTTGKGFIPEIDGLRFVAIITVVLFHLGTHVHETSRFGWTPAQLMADPVFYAIRNGGVGVFVFFAISGFVLGLPFALQYLQQGRPVRLREYYWRRVTRLEPPYVLTMLLFFAALVLAVHRPAGELLPHLGASLAYLHYIIYGKWSEINPVAWSLETEVQFYLLAPVLGLLFTIPGKLARRTALAGGILALASLAAFGLPWLSMLHLDKSILANGHFFLTGFLFADIYLLDLAQRETRAWWWDLAGLLGLAGILYLPHDASYPYLLALSILVLFLAVFQGTWLRRFFRNGWITAIGGMCYTVYLLHYPFIFFVVNRTRRLEWGTSFATNYLVQAAIVLPLLLLASALFFVLVEKPCMYKDWPQRLAAWVNARNGR